jgi:hypothetical protein
MNLPSEAPFWDLDEAGLPAVARALDERLKMTPDDLAAVEENLRVLLDHARILAAAIPMADRDMPTETFEP